MGPIDAGYCTYRRQSNDGAPPRRIRSSGAEKIQPPAVPLDPSLAMGRAYAAPPLGMAVR
jgi:hypothetical protein